MRRFAVLVGAVTLVLVAAALPAHANPPERFDSQFFVLFPDEENELVVFWNISRTAFCDWEAGGFMGSPPVHRDVPVQIVETGKGALVASLHATRPIELWGFDDDADLSGPCQDTDEQLGPWATGAVTVTADDNDLDVSGTRTNSFGNRGQDTVVDGGGGRWHYSFHFRGHCLVDCEQDFSVKTIGTNLKTRGR